MEYRSRGSSTVLFGLLALFIIGLAVVVFDGPPLVEDPVSIERVEWDDPCAHFYEDVENEMGAESFSARYGLPRT